MLFDFTGLPDKFLRLLVVLLLPVLPLAAQVRPVPVTGAVYTSTGTAVEGATVTLHRSADSVAVKTEFSDVEGRFQLEPTALGVYLISVAQLGYTRSWAGPVDVSAPVAPLKLTLAPSAVQLKEVTITAQKPLFERLPDRTVVNVESSILSSGNSVLNVLERAPGVAVDAGENISLRGRKGLLVLLDGKRVPLTGGELANLLRSLPAEQVRSIELITNPSAKYDAQGTAGVIAINLKKDQRQGNNGNANLSYGRGKYGKLSSGVSFNHQQKALNVYGTYAYTKRNGFQNLAFDRTYYQDEIVTSRSTQYNKRRLDLESHTWRTGLDYTVGEKTSVGAVLSGLASRLPVDGQNSSVFYDALGQETLQYTSRTISELQTPNVAGNLTFRHTFRPDSSGTPELTADADIARFGTDRDLSLATAFLSPQLSPRLLTGDQQGTLTIQSVKADYIRPLPNGVRAEAGVKASWVRSNNDIIFFNTIDDITTLDVNQSNGFRYKEDIKAAYVNLTRTRPRLTIAAGLRAEHTLAIGRQTIGNENFDRNYLQLFPNLSVRRTISETHEMGISLSRRLNRPTYNQFNPFRFYVDPTSYRAGNPYLRPQTSYNTELTHTFRKLTTGLSYAYTSNPIVDVYQLDANSLVRLTNANLSAEHYYAFTLAAPLTLTKWWQVYTDAELFYIYFTGKFEGATTLPGRVGAILSANNSFTITKTWSADLNATYNSREQYAFQIVRSRGQVGVGVQKTLLDGRGTLRLNATDLFYTAPVRSTSRYVPLVENQRATQDTRVVTASFAYRFGSSEVAPTRKRTTAAEDEKRRAAGQ
ncbi:outer membrane beta-barrel protein [Hymenobacter tibetensis]|uniref:Outer membrane beta-barrel protein n=1 Tax=Hymenobacter tibetensis TaxID=497967 RepID=A0ABY4D6W4_9BACT|nr:outer membrane beta-barrel protein [Hymenobacter tibetensis]UOG76934.1 outer membrane beta-barrel protein [Hymenobacter tibetensis]